MLIVLLMVIYWCWSYISYIMFVLTSPELCPTLCEPPRIELPAQCHHWWTAPRTSRTQEMCCSLPGTWRFVNIVSFFFSVTHHLSVFSAKPWCIAGSESHTQALTVFNFSGVTHMMLQCILKSVLQPISRACKSNLYTAHIRQHEFRQKKVINLSVFISRDAVDSRLCWLRVVCTRVENVSSHPDQIHVDRTAYPTKMRPGMASWSAQTIASHLIDSLSTLKSTRELERMRSQIPRAMDATATTAAQRIWLLLCQMSIESMEMVSVARGEWLVLAVTHSSLNATFLHPAKIWPACRWVCSVCIDKIKVTCSESFVKVPVFVV